MYGFIYEFILLFSIVIIHELGHACTALSFGWRFKKIQLLPFGGVAEVEEHGNKSLHEEFFVIISGPLMNVIMLILGFSCIHFGIWNSSSAYLFIEYNLLILIFNLLPLWPLDGGKLLQLLLSLFIAYKKAIKYSLRISVGCFIIYVVVVGVYFSAYITLWSVALFLLVAHWLEFKQYHYQYLRFLMERHQHPPHSTKDIDVLSVTVYPHEKLKDVLEKMYKHKLHYFCLVNKNGHFLHIVSEQEILDHYFTKHQPYRAIKEIFG